MNPTAIPYENTIPRRSASRYGDLRSNFDGKQIELFEEQPKKLLEIIADLNLTVNEVEKLVKSEILKQETKYTCIKQLSEDKIIKSIIISRFLVETYVQNSSFDFTDTIKQDLLLNDKIDNIERLKFFEFNYSCLDEDGIDEFIKSLGKEYEEITNKHKHAEISKNEMNRLLLDLLQKIGYISSKSETKNGYKVNHKSIKKK